MPPPSNLDVLLVQLQYPGMTYVESEITRAWLKAHGREYDEIGFNVRLGAGAELGAGFSEETQLDARLLTQKRADIVARVAGGVTIVEVKVRISLGAVGQLLGYRTLWNQANPGRSVVRLLAIGRSVVTDLEPVIREQGIDIETYPRE